MIFKTAQLHFQMAISKVGIQPFLLFSLFLCYQQKRRFKFFNGTALVILLPL